MTHLMMWYRICFVLWPLILSFNLFGATESQILSNQYFRFTFKDKVMSITSFSSSADDNRAVTLWRILNQSINEVKEHLSPEIFSRISFPILVKFDFEQGCNAMWDGEHLLFFQGNDQCYSTAEIPTIVVHELGHALAQNILGNGIVLPTDLSEAIADSFAAIMLNSPLIGDHFNKKQFPQYLRNLSETFSFPNDWRGNYSGSLILSTLNWDFFNLLKENFSISKAKSIMLNSLFTSLRRVKKVSISDFSMIMGEKIKESFSHDLWVEQIMALHGFSHHDEQFGYEITEQGVYFRFPTITDEILVINQMTFLLQKDQREKLIPWSALRKLGNCGQEVAIEAFIFQKSSNLKRSYSEFLVRVGDVIHLNQKSIGLPSQVIIPDQGSLQMPFSLEIKNSETLISLSWKGEIDHLYPGDLLVSLFNQNQFLDGFRGIEERQFTNSHDFTKSIKPLRSLDGQIHFQDVGQGFEGTILSNSLILQTMSARCFKH